LSCRSRCSSPAAAAGREPVHPKVIQTKQQRLLLLLLCLLLLVVVHDLSLLLLLLELS
jgi:hypothetical protein